MRVAMGLALNEIDREARAIEFYEVLSSFDFMSSTPTLFNAGTRRSQLSSCYLTTVADDLDGIYEALKENALLSKFAGGLGNDWTPVRALGSHIKGTNGKSQGVVPFLKVVNDTAVAVNQGGKRKGAVCAYLETWHLDIEEFLELRKNTGDDRRRTHDMNTANWIPDLFMKRVMEGGDWTLFSPSTCPTCTTSSARPSRRPTPPTRTRPARGEIKLFKKHAGRATCGARCCRCCSRPGIRGSPSRTPATCARRSSTSASCTRRNLCTEITLNTSDTEIAVCNLGSVNLAQHVTDGAARPGQAEEDRRHRDAHARQRDRHQLLRGQEGARLEPAPSPGRPRHHGLPGRAVRAAACRTRREAAVEFADRSMEAVCYHAYWASTELAAERGRYSSYRGSLWDRGILPIDSLDLLAEQRGGYVEVDRSVDARLGRAARAHRAARHAQLATAWRSRRPRRSPTSSASSASIEPSFGNLSVKSNLSGEFTIVNEYLVRDLKKLGLWDDVMVMDLKHFDGSLRRIDRVPEDLKALYATAFEIEPQWLVEAAARRQKWIDQAQSLNIYMAGASGKKLDETYKLAWLRGLKTTYYLRTLGATQRREVDGEGGHS